MRLVGLPILERIKQKHSIVRHQVDAWILAVRKAEWRNPQAIKDRYRSADFLQGNRVIFNIKGNQYRVVVKIDYAKRIVAVEWAGTHAEYSKLRF